jgi:hypothetical protein
MLAMAAVTNTAADQAGAVRNRSLIFIIAATLLVYIFYRMFDSAGKALCIRNWQ